MRSGPFTTSEIKAAAVMWHRGYKLREIAESLDRTIGSVGGFVQRHRDLFPRRRTKVTTAMVAEMRRRWEDGRSITKLALDYNLNHHTVSKYITEMS